MSKDIERRHLVLADAELRAEDGEALKLSGYGAVTGRWSQDLGGFKEKIRPGAFVDALKSSDVVITFNHDPTHVMARTSSGTAKVWEDDRGMGYSSDDLANRAISREVVDLVNRRDITGSSFMFLVQLDEWSEVGGKLVREIIKIQEVRDTGPVTYPAYRSTKVSARSLEAACDWACTHGICADEVRAALNDTPARLLARVHEDDELFQSLVELEIARRADRALTSGILGA
jgi:hypothetical protein